MCPFPVVLEALLYFMIRPDYRPAVRSIMISSMKK